MQSEDIAVLGSIVAVTGAVIAITTTSIQRRHQQRTQRVAVLSKALERDDLDESVRRQILAVLTREHAEPERPFFSRPSFWHKASFGVGWMLFLLCGGLILLSYLGVVWTPNMEFVAPMGLIGLGLMSLPMAMREVARRPVADGR